MSTHSTDQAEVFMYRVEEKIRALLRDYSDGKLNSEQFHVIYERYANQRLLAQQAMLTGDAQVLADTGDGLSTLTIKDEHMGKALGLRIYHHHSGACIETMGEFEVSAFIVSPVLTEFRYQLSIGQLIRPRVEKLKERRWLLFSAEPHTTVVTQFRNEPSPLQIREVQRLHHDFEVANQTCLSDRIPDPKALAYPLRTFVQRKVKK
ncbi:MAG: hypothetical protein K8J31_07320 [Anaerolineae bacterium]|nr:hypothetical protein [Anaerolineae bacterium]